MSFDASAEIEINETTEYYDIEGRSLRDLIKDIRKKGPPHDEGKHAIAVTKTGIEPSYRVRQRGKNCNIVSVKTVLNVTIVYPQWVDDYEAPRKEQYKWEKFISKTVDHEDQHSAYSVETAYTLDTELEDLTQTLPCDELKAMATEIIERNLKEMERKNDEFHAEVYKNRR